MGNYLNHVVLVVYLSKEFIGGLNIKASKASKASEISFTLLSSILSSATVVKVCNCPSDIPLRLGIRNCVDTQYEIAWSSEL